MDSNFFEIARPHQDNFLEWLFGSGVSVDGIFGGTPDANGYVEIFLNGARQHAEQLA